MNTYFSPDRLLPIYDGMIADIASEMPRQLERWPKRAAFGTWEWNVAYLRQILIEKPELDKKNLQTYFHLSDEEMQELFPD
jgi:hypothetical protein